MVFWIVGFRSTIVNTLVHLTLIPIENDDPGYCLVELLKWNYNVFLKTMICTRVNWFSLNDDVKSLVYGTPTMGSLMDCLSLWRHLQKLWLMCFKRWVCTCYGLRPKQTLQSLQCNKQMPSLILKTMRLTSRSKFGTILNVST